MSASSPSALRHLETELAGLAEHGLLREPPRWPPGAVVLCSNDYLGYAARDHGDVDGLPWGATASRLVSGDHEAHHAAEAALARWLGQASALLFSSGYAANVGTIAALAGPGDVIVSDRLNHASIIDGCRLSGATVRVVPHCDTKAVESVLRSAGSARRRWVVTESYFSMDATTPDFPALRAACSRQDAGLVVDEAHALGCFGPRGTGLCAAAGVVPDVLIGTLGKAFGLQGAFVAGSSSLRAWLWNRARSFVFSTGVSPLLAREAARRVGWIESDDVGRARLVANGARLRSLLGRISGAVVLGHGPVIPWLVGESSIAVSRSHELAERGVVVQPIRPPTVPMGAARLRISATASLSEKDLDAVARALDCFT